MKGFKITKIDWMEEVLVLYKHITKLALIEHIMSSIVLSTFYVLSYLILIAILYRIKYIHFTKEILRHRVSGRTGSLKSGSRSII